MRLLVTRPEPDALKLRAALEEHGHEATVEPLLSVSFEDGGNVRSRRRAGADRHQPQRVRALKSHPLRGPRASCRCSRSGARRPPRAGTGFETVVTGAGTAEELVAHIVSVAEPSAGLLLHLAGDSWRATWR